MTTAATASLSVAEGASAIGERELAFMRRALAAAELAGDRGEVPVGAVVVVGGEIVAVAHNERETGSDPTAHAEILALRRAATALGRWRLTDADLYVTMEPCPMCAGALVNARVRRLYFGCDDPKAGAVRTLFTLAEDPRLNHRVEVVPGVLAAEGAALLRGFFSRLRQPEGRER
ncbi:MAG TPA: tRNA adenosine(34) deaminase TadA [Polyangia bacterium]|jgi:tRNA(adenine34) deaminase